jgi:hypothetical protein
MPVASVYERFTEGFVTADIRPLAPCLRITAVRADKVHATEN